MSLPITHPERASGFQAKYVLLGIFCLMALFVIYHNEQWIIDHSSADWKHFYDIRWWLLPHGIAGTLALFLGPLQFSKRIRQRNLRLHRIVGRCYVAGVAICSPLAIYIGIVHTPPILSVAAVVQATAWMLTTGAAFLCARRGNIPQHRQWVVRSYAIALIFLEVRVVQAIPAITRMGLDGVTYVVWTCIALSLLVPEFIIQWRGMFPAKASGRVGSPGLRGGATN
jgi:uncharacterized membrane protein